VSQDDNGKLSSLYRAGAHEEPPPWLDERIRAAASREARPSSFRRLLDVLERWQMPLGLAAVVALAASLTLMMQSEKPQLISDAGSPASQVRSDASEEAVRAPTLRRELLPGQSDPMAPPVTASRPAPDSASVSGQTDSAAGDAVQPPSQSARSSAGSPPSAEVIAAYQVEHSRSYEPSSGAALASAPASPAAPRPPQAAPALEERPKAAALSRRVQVADRRDETLSDSKVSAAEVSDVVPAHEHDPAAWLRHLVELSNQGRERDAREGLRRFLARYPEHVLPEVLQKLR
jgi:hypothetical protein